MSGVYFTFFPYLFFSPSSPFSLFFGIFMFRCFCKPSRSICRGKFIARVLKDTAKSMTLLFVDTLFRLYYGFVIFTRFNLLTPLTLCYTSQTKFIRLIYECTIYMSKEIPSLCSANAYLCSMKFIFCYIFKTRNL